MKSRLAALCLIAAGALAATTWQAMALASASVVEVGFLICQNGAPGAEIRPARAIHCKFHVPGGPDGKSVGETYIASMRTNGSALVFAHTDVVLWRVFTRSGHSMAVAALEGIYTGKTEALPQDGSARSFLVGGTQEAIYLVPVGGETGDVYWADEIVAELVLASIST